MVDHREQEERVALGPPQHEVDQRRIRDALLERLAEPEFARKQGLAGERMLSPASLKAVRYSFNLVESTPGGNRVVNRAFINWRQGRNVRAY